MRYLVTGAAGFIGSHITDRLLAEGHTVIGIDNFETGQAGNVNDSAVVIRGDITNESGISGAFAAADPDVVFHCAASYKDPSAWGKDILTNAFGTALITKLAQGYNSRLIYFQTGLCYGNTPRNEVEVTSFGGKRQWLPTDGPINTRARLAPESSYAISKTAGEQYIINADVSYVSFRLANMYGPRNLSGPIPTFARNIMQGRKSVVTESRRDYVFVDDLIDLLWRVLATDYVGIVHASSGRDYSIASAYVAVADALGVDPASHVEFIPRPPDDAPSILLDPSETISEFGWSATTPFEQGIAKAVAWYRDNPVGETFTHLRIPTAA